MSSIEDYRTAKGWSGFGSIVALTDEDPKPTKVNRLIAVDNTIKPYAIDGKSLPKVQRGLNILRMNNGIVKKVFVK